MKNRFRTFVLILLTLIFIASAITINAFAVPPLVSEPIKNTTWELNAGPPTADIVTQLGDVIVSGLVWYVEDEPNVYQSFDSLSVSSIGDIRFYLNGIFQVEVDSGYSATIEFTSEANKPAFYSYLQANGTLVASGLTFQLLSGTGAVLGTYSYSEGMTWGEWVNSSFNVDGFEISNVYSGDLVEGDTQIDVFYNVVVTERPTDSDGITYAYTVNSINGLPVNSSDIISLPAYEVNVYRDLGEDFARGYEEGYTDGYDDGFGEGYYVGVSDGYNQGVDDTFAQDLLGSTLETPFNALREFVLFEANGIEVNALSIIYALIGFGLFMFLLKMIAGG